MNDDCEKERARLFQRTTDLHEQTKALCVSSRPISSEEYDALLDQVHQHQLDLDDFRRRCLDKPVG
jgi:hypothetical protein